jgi:hypothetical protein
MAHQVFFLSVSVSSSSFCLCLSVSLCWQRDEEIDSMTYARKKWEHFAGPRGLHNLVNKRRSEGIPMPFTLDMVTGSRYALVKYDTSTPEAVGDLLLCSSTSTQPPQLTLTLLSLADTRQLLLSHVSSWHLEAEIEEWRRPPDPRDALQDRGGGRHSRHHRGV